MLKIAVNTFCVHERILIKLRRHWQIAVTQLWPRPKGKLISDFESKEDLIACLLTSCHIPWYELSCCTITILELCQMFAGKGDAYVIECFACNSQRTCCGRWFDGGIARTFRGSMHYDGGLTNFIPVRTICI